MDKTKIISDYHVHFGQYNENYYQPATIIKCLYNNGIKNAWISSTTSCIEWANQEEKKYLIKHVEDEIEEAVLTANELGLNLTPLYWVVPQRHIDGETIEDVLANSYYKGFKIHTKVGDWANDTPFIRELFEKVCICAKKYSMPILIHTGVDIVDAPNKFEEFFSKYSDVKFILAHCKDTESIIKVFRKYNNVCGDISFCPKENYTEICKYGFKNRMLFGTDFPISHWLDKTNRKNGVSEKILTNFYQKNKDEIKNIFNEV